MVYLLSETPKNCSAFPKVRAFWQEVGKQMEIRLRQDPGRSVWLSTSGLGVYWLHMRLDSYPKYYTHDEYKKRKE